LDVLYFGAKLSIFFDKMRLFTKKVVFLHVILSLMDYFELL